MTRGGERGLVKAKEAAPSVDVLVLNWNGKDHLSYSLPSILQCDYPSMRVVVVDNGSDDGSVRFVKEAYPQVAVMELGANIGFAAGYNRAMGRSREEGVDFALLANNDVRVDRAWVGELVKVAEGDPQIAFLGSKILSWDGKTIEHSGSVFKRGIGAGGYALEEDRGQHEETRYAFYTCGGSMMVRLSATRRLGLFDESFFIYSEDVDLCYRGWIFGLKSVYVPRSVLYHRCGVTTKAHGSEWRHYTERKNSLTMMLKNYELRTLLRFRRDIWNAYFRRGNRSNNALFFVLSRLPWIVMERFRIQRRRVLSDERIVRIVESGVPRLGDGT